ncbi:MAG: hypothetical protein MZV65_12970 [Chromatiales bacterium]|nr:hypothetical protein [Chromatiales bacterium]
MARLKGVFGDPGVRVVPLRRKKDRDVFALQPRAAPDLRPARGASAGSFGRRFSH